MTRDEILSALRRTIVSVVPETAGTAIEPHMTLAELGCNSIDRAEILALTLEDLAIAAPLHELSTGGDLDALAGRLAERA